MAISARKNRLTSSGPRFCQRKPRLRAAIITEPANNTPLTGRQSQSICRGVGKDGALVFTAHSPTGDRVGRDQRRIIPFRGDSPVNCSSASPLFTSMRSIGFPPARTASRSRKGVRPSRTAAKVGQRQLRRSVSMGTRYQVMPLSAGRPRALPVSHQLSQFIGVRADFQNARSAGPGRCTLSIATPSSFPFASYPPRQR